MLILILLLFALFFLAFIYRRLASSGPKDFPGPWKLPIVGHLPFLGLLPHVTLMEWGKEYGPMISVQFGSFSAVVINDASLIKLAMNNPALAGRPRIKYFDETTRNRRGFVLSDGTRAHEHRKFIQRTLKDFGYGRDSMESKITEQIPELLEIFESRLDGAKLEVNHAFDLSVIKYLWGIVMGERIKSDDADFQYLCMQLTTFTKLSPILSLAIFLPKLLYWFPKWTGYDEKLKLTTEVHHVFKNRLQRHKATRIQGDPSDLTDSYLDKMDELPDILTDESVALAISELIASGIDTSTTALTWLVYFLVKFPSAQRKFRAEVHSTIGSDRLPRLSDRASLPYVEAFIQEMLRKTSFAPLGLFHSALQDTDVNGQIIRKDSIVIANLYAANHDPRLWGDPEVFRPERFLDEQSKLKKMDGFMPFGTGKRGCIGENLARSQLFLYIVSIVQSYELIALGNLPDDRGVLGVTTSCRNFTIKVSRA